MQRSGWHIRTESIDLLNLNLKWEITVRYMELMIKFGDGKSRVKELPVVETIDMSKTIIIGDRMYQCVYSEALHANILI